MWYSEHYTTLKQCFSYHDYPNKLVVVSSAGHDYEVRDTVLVQVVPVIVGLVVVFLSSILW